MDLQELKRQINEEDDSLRSRLRNIFQCMSIGGRVRPEYAAALEQSQTVNELLDAVLEDDALRFEQAWGLAAHVRKARWLGRFEPRFVKRGIPFRGKGVYVKLGNEAMVLPVLGVGRHVDVYLFDDGALNEHAAEYFTSIEGLVTIEDVSFEGTFDVFRTKNALIFEQWDLNERGQRTRAANLAEKFCKTS